MITREQVRGALPPAPEGKHWKILDDQLILIGHTTQYRRPLPQMEYQYDFQGHRRSLEDIWLSELTRTAEEILTEYNIEGDY